MMLPLELLARIAVHVQTATGVNAVAERAPTAWREASDPYIVVTQVTDVAPELRGDGRTIRDRGTAQATLFERAGDDDPARLEALIAALDGTVVHTDYGRGTVVGWRQVPEPSTDDVTQAVDVTYRAAR